MKYFPGCLWTAAHLSNCRDRSPEKRSFLCAKSGWRMPKQCRWQHERQSADERISLSENGFRTAAAAKEAADWDSVAADCDSTGRDAAAGELPVLRRKLQIRVKRPEKVIGSRNERAFDVATDCPRAPAGNWAPANRRHAFLKGMKIRDDFQKCRKKLLCAEAMIARSLQAIGLNSQCVKAVGNPGIAKANGRKNDAIRRL
jgi:hypothetical protein